MLVAAALRVQMASSRESSVEKAKSELVHIPFLSLPQNLDAIELKPQLAKSQINRARSN